MDISLGMFLLCLVLSSLATFLATLIHAICVENRTLKIKGSRGGDGPGGAAGGAAAGAQHTLAVARLEPPAGVGTGGAPSAASLYLPLKQALGAGFLRSRTKTAGQNH